MVKALKKDEVSSVLNFSIYESYVSKGLLNQCEVFKFNILNKEIALQSEIENSFWEAENLKNSQGNIQYFFEVLDLNIEDAKSAFPLLLFNKLLEFVKLTFEIPSDLMRQALLTFGSYYTWHGHTVRLNSNRYFLGIAPSFYGSILNTVESVEKGFLIEFLKDATKNIDLITNDEVKNWLHQQVEDYDYDADSIYSLIDEHLINDAEFLNFMTKKMLCINYDNDEAYLLAKEKVTGEHSYQILIAKD